MPRKAFLKKKSLLDRFKDDYATHTGYIQSARAEHTWNNPLTRKKRTKELNRWIKSFAGKDHIHKLARFNATNAGRYESMYNEAMSLKGFLENLTEKLTKQFNLDAEKVQAYLDSHTQEMQELLDDKELSLKEKVLFVRSEITGEQDEAVKPSEAIKINTPIVLYKGDAENAEKAFKYLCDKIPHVKSAYFYCNVKPTDGNNYCGVGIRGPRTYAQSMFYNYANLYNDDFWNNCDADPQGWVNPQTIARYDVATPRQESNKQTNEMVGNKKWVIRIKRLGKNYYVCSSSFRVNKAFRYPSLGGPFVCSDWDITERDIAKYDNYNDAKKAWDGMAQVLRGGLPFYKEGEDYEIVQVNFSMMGESKKHEGYGGSTSVMGIWGKRPRDVYPEVSYSSVNDMYNTLLKHGYGDKHPIYYKNNSPEQIKKHILGYFKWTPTNSDADIEADALAAATMIKNNFNKSESKKHEGFNTTRDLNNFALHILNYIKDKTHYPGYIRFVKLNDNEEDFYGKYLLSVNGKNYYLYVGDTDYTITDNNDENTLVEGSTDLSGAMQKDLNDFCERITQPFYTESKESTDEKLGYEKGHKNSRGEDAPWVIRSHEDNRILASFANKKDAEEHMKRMKQYSKSESYELANKEIQVRKPNGTWQRWSVTWPEYVDTHIQDAKDQGWTEVRVVDIKRNENTEEHKKSEGLSNEKVKDAVKFAATEAGLENYLNVNSDGAMSVTVSLPINSDDLKTVRWVIDSNDGTITEYLDTEKNLTRDFTDDESLVSMLTLLFQTSRMELRDWLPKKSESVNMGGFKNMLRTYNAKGGSVKNGPWRICDGAYDLWFELYYNDTPILGCTDNICKWYSNPETVGMTLDDYKKIEDAISSEIFAIDSFKMPESKKSESLADNPLDIHTQLSNLIKQDKIITFLNDVDGPVIYMDASKGSIPYGDYLLKYLGIDSSAMMISSATVYNVEDIESYDILNGLSSSFVDSQKKKGINKVCKITTKYLTKPKKSESREDGENAYDDYWTLIEGLKALGFEPSSHIRNGMIYCSLTGRETNLSSGLIYRSTIGRS